MNKPRNLARSVTIDPGVYNAFWPESKEAIIGEVSTANDDAHDKVSLWTRASGDFRGLTKMRRRLHACSGKPKEHHA